MKITNIIRGAGLTLVTSLVLTASVCFVPEAEAGSPVAQQASIYIDGTTNSIPIGGSNITRSVVLTISTNFFNIGPASTQPNTNAWPAQPLVSSFGLGERFLFLSGSVIGNFGGTNGVEVLVIAGGTVNSPATNGFGTASTNLWRIPINYTGTTNANWATNIDTQGIPFLWVQQIENTNNIVLTNGFNQPVSKFYQ